MRIHHVAADIDRQASGVSYAVPALCQALACLNHEVVLHALEPVPDTSFGFSMRAYPGPGGVRRRLGVSAAMRTGLNESAQHADIMHNHGVWRMANIYPARATRRNAQCRFVVSPEGMLEPWAMRHRRVRKKIMWLLIQKASLASAHLFHASTEREYDSIRALGFSAPVAVIPYGIDVPEPNPPRAYDDGVRRLLYLARVHPIKALDHLIRAWVHVQASHPEWTLEIVGLDEAGYQARMADLAASLGAQRVRFAGEIPDARKSACFTGADLYVLPSHSESWGVSVAEALAHGLPVIVSRHAPWADILKHDCGWWIDNSVDAIAACLRKALAEPRDALRARGARGRVWMQDEFGWPAVGYRMEQAFRWLLDGGEQPGFVRGSMRSELR